MNVVDISTKEPEIDEAEREALEAFARIDAPLPKWWVPIAGTEGFDHSQIAYGVVHLDRENDVSEDDRATMYSIDWAVWLRWDGWPVMLDDLEQNEEPKVATAPPEVILHVMSVGARAILHRLDKPAIA